MRDTWFSARAIGLHAAIVVVVPGFLWLGWWQLHRALAGNGLSWAYTVEWPFFCVYAVFMWWRLVHDVAHDRAARMAQPAREADGRGKAAAPAPAPAAASAPHDRAAVARETPAGADDGSGDPYDEELAAYNSYLASLDRQRRHKRG